MRVVNTTIKLEDFQINAFENYLRQHLEVIDFRIVPDTNELYEKDNTFRKLVKAVKTARKVRDTYINDKNGNYTNKD